MHINTHTYTHSCELLPTKKMRPSGLGSFLQLLDRYLKASVKYPQFYMWMDLIKSQSS